MQVTTTYSTKGGTGKTTGSANLGALAADSGLRTLLIDLDTGQPTLSSYFELAYTAPGGVYDLLVHNIVEADKVISRTQIPNLDIILSNDPHNQLETLLLHAPDGRLRLRSLLSRLPNDYDLVIIDTKGTSAVTVEMALVAANNAISPLYPEMLAAREFHRGTLQVLQGVNNLRRTLGLDELPLNVVFNRQDNSNDARDIALEIRDLLGSMGDSVKVLTTHIPALVTYRVAASQGVPAHHLERSKPSNRRAASALDTMKSVACEVWPSWEQRFQEV
ncbi:ParA family protein [Stutzerimonas stutzeri]